MPLFKSAFWQKIVSVALSVAVILKNIKHMLTFVHIKAHSNQKEKLSRNL